MAQVANSADGLGPQTGLIPHGARVPSCSKWCGFVGFVGFGGRRAYLRGRQTLHGLDIRLELLHQGTFSKPKLAFCEEYRLTWWNRSVIRNASPIQTSGCLLLSMLCRIMSQVNGSEHISTFSFPGSPAARASPQFHSSHGDPPVTARCEFDHIFALKMTLDHTL